jgi:hypothetical protein
VTQTASARGALEVIRADAAQNVVRSVGGAETPVPISPVLTAVRSTTPTLRWEPMPGAREYKVVVTYPSTKEGGRIVCPRTSVGAGTQVTLSDCKLQQGEVYVWQVETTVDDEVRLSPPAGFWVIDEKAAREVTAAEQNHGSSALVLASVYAKHGLNVEALTQAERLHTMNPSSPQARKILDNLRRRTAGQ